jgi:F-type H+-transporting ATPase subunit epsilon
VANTLQLDIVTPSSSVYSGPAAEVVIPAWEGQMGIYPNHDTLLALLRAGLCTVATPEGTTRYVIGRGFAEMGPDRVTLLTDSCELATEVDKGQAQSDLVEAQAKRDAATPFTGAYDQAVAAVEHAQARLDA